MGVGDYGIKLCGWWKSGEKINKTRQVAVSAIIYSLPRMFRFVSRLKNFPKQVMVQNFASWAPREGSEVCSSHVNFPSCKRYEQISR
jgi:hypothetical protein